MSKGGKNRNESGAECLEDLILDLQKFDYRVDDEYLKKIISYGATATTHLEKILIDILDGQSQINFNEPVKLTDSFRVVHALNLLAHLHASSALKTVLSFFSQKQIYVDYWLGGIFDEDLWEILFKLGQNDIRELKYFLLNKKYNEFYRLAAAKALVQIALHHEEKAEDIRNIFQTLLILEDEDRDFIGFIVSELMDWRDEKLKPIILKKLNEVDVYCGMITAEEVELLYSKKKRSFVREPQSLFDLYKNYREVFHFGDKADKKDKSALKNINLDKTPKF